jgi:hypothetical protein
MEEEGGHLDCTGHRYSRHGQGQEQEHLPVVLVLVLVLVVLVKGP